MITKFNVKQKTEKRFWSKIDFKSHNECWMWAACKDQKGYGMYQIGHKKNMRSHRFLYIVLFGKIDNGVLVCHKCDNPSCVNPNHLFCGSVLDNNRDRNNKNRQAFLRGELNGNSVLTELNVIDIKRRLREGDMQKDIAIDFGVGKSTIAAINTGRLWANTGGDGNKIKYRNQFKKRGDSNVNSKLNRDKVLEIRRQILEGKSQRHIAKMFNVAQTQISSIKTGRTWAYIS